MKATRLLIAAALLTATAASANNHDDKSRHSDNVDEVTLIIGGDSTDPEILEFESPQKMKEHLKERKLKKELQEEQAALQITEAIPADFSDVQAPAFIFTQKDNKFSFGIGGFINLRTSYDFNGIVENIDFVTAEIPIPGDYATKQQVMMDASTSRIYMTAVANTRALGAIKIYMDMDLRGGAGYTSGTGVTNKYTPRVRRAYASFLGVTIGRDITTFCDLAATATTIDFQGPNAYAFNYATLIRYEHNFCDDHFTAAIALEQPNLSATYGDYFEPIPQRVPDVPVYLQYKFGRTRSNHFRAAAVFRDMYAYSTTKDENTALFGWGVQFTGHLEPFSWLGICGGGTYGRGITPYIQDLIGSGLDFTPNPSKTTSIQTMPMYAWQASANINFTDRLVATGGYSMVKVDKENGYYSDDQFRKTQYMFGNLFYNLTPRLQLACEYIHGTRRNMNCQSNYANRGSLMAQFNF
ncbi:MAG: DcaP family trimeric outer membrane transporter [Rikenellaceae bacterium]